MQLPMAQPDMQKQALAAAESSSTAVGDKHACQNAWSLMAPFTRTLMRAAAVMRISRKRGIPSVTLASPRPAMWKVLSVIYRQQDMCHRNN
jgi:hypothetical protein